MRWLAGLVVAAALAPVAAAANEAEAAKIPPAWKPELAAYLGSWAASPDADLVVRGPRQTTVRAGLLNVWTGWAICYAGDAAGLDGRGAARQKLMLIYDEWTGIVGSASTTSGKSKDVALIERECGYSSDDASLVFAAQAAASVPPSEQAWKPTIERYFEESLKDPYSAVKKVSRGPRRSKISPDVYTTYKGWAVCYSVNAKNSYGAYVGTRPYLFVLDGQGSILGVVKDAEDHLVYQWIIDRECALPADKAKPKPSADNPEIPL